MKRQLILFFILILIGTSFSAVQAVDNEEILTLGDVSVENGVISTSIRIAPPDDIDEPVKVALYLRHSSDCGDSIYLTWLIVPPSEFKKTITIQAPVADILIGKEFTLAANAKITDLPAPCTEPSVLSKSFKIPDDMPKDQNQTIQAMPGDSKSGPVFQIEKLSFTDLKKSYRQGDTIIVQMTVKNIGSDDPVQGPVQVNGYLGQQELIPTVGYFPHLNKDETATVSLRYSIPRDATYRSYPFTILIDPYALHAGLQEGKSKIVPGLINMVPPDTLSLQAECTNCWGG